MSITEVHTQVVVAGVDTHQLTHHAVVLDTTGRRLGDRGFEASTAGYAALLDWVASFGLIEAVGVESSGSYGAGLTLALVSAGVEVVEVARPEKATRARHGKCDPVDAESGACQMVCVRSSSSEMRDGCDTGTGAQRVSDPVR